jgi:hypothetical protein
VALSGIVPVTDEPLRLAIAPFAGESRNSLARIAVALGLDLAFAGGGVGDTIDLEMRVFDAEGRKQVENAIPHKRSARAAAATAAKSKCCRRSRSSPAATNIRAAMHSQLGEGGAVSTRISSCRFRAGPALAVRHLVSTVPDKPSMPPGEFASWLVGNPTTSREFLRRDRVAIFARAYARADTAPESIAIGAEIRDARSGVFTKSDTLPIGGNTSPKGADYRLRLPLDTLASGEYLLTIRASGRAESEVRREVRFTVR